MKICMGEAGLLAALISTSSCSSSRPLPPPALRIEEPTARLSPGGLGAAYLSIVNATDTDDRLTTVEASAVGSVFLHEVVTSGDVARMVARPEGFVVRVGETLELRPGGKHVMLLGVERAEERRSIALILHFERAGAVAVDAQVVPLAHTE